MTLGQIRRAMAAGIAFVVLLVVGVLYAFGNSPDIKNHDSDAVTAAKYVQKLSSSSNRTGIIVGAYLMLLAALAFVWFTQGLRAWVPSLLAGRVVGALGIVGATAITISAMAFADVAGAVSFGHEKVPANGDTIRVVMDLGFPFLGVVFALASAVLIATVALHGRKGGLPAWITISAWLGVLGAVFAVIFLPILLPVLWFLAVAIFGLVRPGTGHVDAIAGST